MIRNRIGAVASMLVAITAIPGATAAREQFQGRQIPFVGFRNEMIRTEDVKRPGFAEGSAAEKDDPS